MIILLFVFSLSSKLVNAQHSHGGGGHGSHDDAADAVKIVIVGNIQAAFEIYDKAKYNEMAKSMNMGKSPADRNSSHFVIISLMDKSEMKVIKNASVEVEITTPGFARIKKKAHAMEGGGMSHYASDFQMNQAGNYKVIAEINLNGKKIKAETDFTVK